MYNKNKSILPETLWYIYNVIKGLSATCQI